MPLTTPGLMMATWTEVSSRRVFAIDCETRPGPYGGQDFTFRNMLSIAGVFEDDISNPIYLGPGFLPGQLGMFARQMQKCLVVTHNGPRYDLPLLNGTLIKNGLEPLGPILVSDTYAHLPKRGQAFSASLGNLATRFDVGEQKGHMGEVGWEAAYAGERKALEQLRDYNIGDCITTLALRKKLLDMGLLGPPRVWRGC